MAAKGPFEIPVGMRKVCRRFERWRKGHQGAVLPPDAVAAGKPETDESASAGHGRHGAAAFTGFSRVSAAHKTLHAGDRLWKWWRTSPKNVVMCWRRWVAFITTTRWRGNRNCRRKRGCFSIRSTAGR